MKKALIAATASLAASSATAEDFVSNPRGVIANFDVANVGPVLSELGAVWQQRQGPNGQPYIVMSAAGDLSMMLIPTACAEGTFTNCVGMNTVVAFSGAGFNHQTVTAFNQRYWFSTAGLSEDGSGAYLSRYDIADYGIARGNVASSILNLYELARVFRTEIASAAKTVSQEGYAEDLSARRLNATGLEAIGGSAPSSLSPRHQAAFEEAEDFVRVLLQDEATPRNKIENAGSKPR